MSDFQEFVVAFASALAAEGVVIFPCTFQVFLHFSVIFKCSYTGYGVINIVERAHEEMLFLHPEATLFHEFIAVIISPWKIDFFQFVPYFSSFHCVCQIFSVHTMLEFVYACHVRHCFQRIPQICFFLFLCIFAKEQMHPWQCEIFHCHRMDLADLCGTECLR